MYLAKAFYKKKDFAQCKKITVNLMVKHPEDLRLKFNMAYCLYQEANDIFNLPSRPLKLTRTAIKNLKQSRSILSTLMDALKKAGTLGHQAYYPQGSA